MNKPVTNLEGAAKVRPLTVAIQAMGGEGGGVLADWIIDLAEHGGYIAQATSVPGVAQRTGATIYYLELFPKAAARDRDPVLALMPVPGDVDIVIASELMEGARAVQRGLVTKDKTTLIVSTHRVYAIGERTALADGRADSETLLDVCKSSAKQLHAFDMAALSESTGSVISAVLFGALAGSGAMPFQRMAFEATIRRAGVGVQPSLAAFGAGFEGAKEPPRLAGEAAKAEKAPSPAGRELLASVEGNLTPLSRPIIAAGVARLLDYQGRAYAQLYLDRLAPLFGKSDELLTETARQLALGMAYEDTIRVAELKIRAERFARVRSEVGAKDNQILTIAEFMHPRTQEIADTLPAPLGRFILRSKAVRGLLDRMTGKGRVVETTSLRGFLLLYMVSSLKPLRARSLRFGEEQAYLVRWLDAVVAYAQTNERLAIEIAHCRNLVKGYGDTYERGRRKFERIMSLVPSLAGKPSGAATIADLRKAALADEDGRALERAVKALSVSPSP